MSRLLFGMCGAKTETLAVVRNFTFFTGAPKGSETFCTDLINKLFIFSKKFQNFWSTIRMVYVHIATDCPVLRQILFLMHCFACFDETIDSISGISHEKVKLQ